MLPFMNSSFYVSEGVGFADIYSSARPTVFAQLLVLVTQVYIFLS